MQAKHIDAGVVEDLEWILEKALSFKTKPEGILEELKELVQCEQDVRHKRDREKLNKRPLPVKGEGDLQAVLLPGTCGSIQEKRKGDEHLFSMTKPRLCPAMILLAALQVPTLLRGLIVMSALEEGKVPRVEVSVVSQEVVAQMRALREARQIHSKLLPFVPVINESGSFHHEVIDTLPLANNLA